MVVKDNKLSFSKKLREKRLDMGFSQMDVAKRAGVKQATISKYENDDSIVIDKGLKEAKTILEAFGFKDYEIQELTRQYFPEYQTLAPNFAQADTSAQALYVGKINGGLKTMLSATSESLYVSVPSWIADRYNLEDIFVATVAGDSMADEAVRESLPEGTECYFHRSIKPEVKDIVAVWLEREDIGIIKVYNPQSTYTVLESYNKGHAPIIINELNTGILQGVLIGQSKPQPRFRR